MTSVQNCIYAFLISFLILFPKDCLLFPLWLEGQIKLHYVNAKCFVITYFMWKKLSISMKEQGWPAPPFRFIPIWKRTS
jgi:hypothetical protein